MNGRCSFFFSVFSVALWLETTPIGNPRSRHMRPVIRGTLMGLLALWSLSHAAVFGDQIASGRSTASAEKIKKALEQPIILDFIGPSLHAALEHIADKAGMPFSIDQVALANLGISA